MNSTSSFRKIILGAVVSVASGGLSFAASNTSFSGDRVTVSSDKSFEDVSGAVKSLVRKERHDGDGRGQPGQDALHDRPQPEGHTLRSRQSDCGQATVRAGSRRRTVRPAPRVRVHRSAGQNFRLFLPPSTPLVSTPKRDTRHTPPP